MAQLVERSLPTPVIHGLNIDTSKILSTKRKDENKEKEAGNGPSLKKELVLALFNVLLRLAHHTNLLLTEIIISHG